MKKLKGYNKTRIELVTNKDILKIITIGKSRFMYTIHTTSDKSVTNVCGEHDLKLLVELDQKVVCIDILVISGVLFYELKDLVKDTI